MAVIIDDKAKSVLPDGHNVVATVDMSDPKRAHIAPSRVETVNREQLRDEVDSWIRGGTIEGQRRARIIRTTAYFTKNLDTATGEDLNALLGDFSGEIGVCKSGNGLTDEELDSFLNVSSTTASLPAGRAMLRAVSKEEDTLGDQFMTRGLRARYAKSYEHLLAFTRGMATEDLIDASPKQRSPWEESASQTYDLMRSAYDRKGHGPQEPGEVLFDNMLRVAGVVTRTKSSPTTDGLVSRRDLKSLLEDRSDDVVNTAKPMSKFEWISFVESRRDNGLTETDMNNSWLTDQRKTAAKARSSELTIDYGVAAFQQEIETSLGYTNAANALDRYLKNPVKFTPSKMQA